jgi:hypothetical protein
MKRSPRPRKQASLSDSVLQRLNMYAVAASAACMGVLMTASTAEGKIVYTSVNERVGPNKPFPIVLNPEGKSTFFLLLTNFTDSGVGFENLKICHRPYVVGRSFDCTNSYSATNALNQVRARAGSIYAGALRAGAKIQNGDRFVGKGVPVDMGRVRYQTSTSTQLPRWYGPWVNGGKGVKDRYLGLKFKMQGRFHFGWARLTVTTTPQHTFVVKLIDYAYETIPGKAIVAGATKDPTEDPQPVPASLNTHTAEPASLGVLALGAPGLSIWRREESVSATPERN